MMRVINSLENRKITSQEGGFLNFLKPLIAAALPLAKNLLTLSAKSVLIPLELTAAASATDEANQKQIFGSGTTALIILNEEIEDIIKIVKSLKESELPTRGISKTIKNEEKEEKGALLGMLLETLAASILGNEINRIR